MIVRYKVWSADGVGALKSGEFKSRAETSSGRLSSVLRKLSKSAKKKVSSCTEDRGQVIGSKNGKTTHRLPVYRVDFVGGGSCLLFVDES